MKKILMIISVFTLMTACAKPASQTVEVEETVQTTAVETLKSEPDVQAEVDPVILVHSNPALYAKLLNQYVDVILNDDAEGFEGSEMLMHLKEMSGKDAVMNETGFAWMDLNDDGLLECMIGSIQTYDDNLVTLDEIYALFTLDNHETKCIFSAVPGRMNAYTYLGAKQFSYRGNDGANKETAGLFHLDADENIIWDSYMFAVSGGGEWTVYENTTGEVDISESMKSEMDYEDFVNMRNEEFAASDIITSYQFSQINNQRFVYSYLGLYEYETVKRQIQEQYETENEGDMLVVFQSNGEPLHDFIVNKLVVDEEGYHAEAVCDLASLNDQTPIVLNLNFAGDTDSYFVSFTDSGENSHFYQIYISGKDGFLRMN